MSKRCIALFPALVMALTFTLSATAETDKKWKEKRTPDGWTKVTNDGGVTLGYSKSSGLALIEADGYTFKDMNRNGELDAYEDWRLDAVTRAQDLASKLSGQEIGPLLTHGGWMKTPSATWNAMWTPPAIPTISPSASIGPA